MKAKHTEEMHDRHPTPLHPHPTTYLPNTHVLCHTT